MRPSGRALDQLREVRITRHYTKHAEGSVLVEFGDTKVICTASKSNYTCFSGREIGLAVHYYSVA